jgi:hypothetical protein
VHGERFGELDAGLFLDLHHVPHGGLLGVIRLRRITWSWSDTLVLDVETLCGCEVLLWSVTPGFLSYVLVNLLSKSLCKSIGQGFHHHIVVVVAFFNVLFADFLLLESSRTSEESNIISLSTRLWSNEIAHGNEVVLVFVKLLSECAVSCFEGGAIVLVVNFNIIIIIRVARIEPNNGSSLYEVTVDDLFEHFLGSIIELLSLLTNIFVFEDLWVGPVGVLASDLPGLEEWIPVDVWKNLLKIIIFIDLGAEEGRLDDSETLPVGSEGLRSSLGEGDEALVLLAVVVLFSQFFVLGLDVVLVLLLVERVEELLDDDNSSGGVENVGGLIVLVVWVDFDGGVHLGGGGSTDQEWDVDSSLSELLGIEDHFIKGWGNESGQSNDVGLFSLHAVDDCLA